MKSLFQHSTSSRSVAIALLGLFAAPALQTSVEAQDQKAAFAPMFNPTGHDLSQPPVHLYGTQLPELGGVMGVDLVAGGAAQGFVLLGIGTSTGIPIPLQGRLVSLYLEPISILDAIPLPMQPNGIGHLRLPVPPDPRLIGADLAMQGVTMDILGGVRATNLLAANVGVFGAPGRALFAFTHTATIPRNSYLMDKAHRPQKMAVYCNATSKCTKVTFTGAKNQSRGDLEIRDGAGKVVATIDKNSTIISVTVTVPAGGKLYFYNNGNGTMNGLTWEIEVSDC